jgi:flagellar hook protein FlgE
MSLFSTLNTGITGLATNGLGLGVAGDNIANLNTVGFKGSSAEFEDLVLQQLGGGRGQLGMGAFTQRVRIGFGQGGIEATGNAADLALDGRGFFAVRNAEGASFYTRAGQFARDADGFLVHPSGLRLQGYLADASGALSSQIGDLVIPNDPVPGTATSEVAITANLQAGSATLPAIAGSTFTSFSDLADAASFTTSAIVYDSLGNQHDVTLAYTQTAAGTWEFTAWADAGELGGTAGEPQEISSGTLVFDGNGQLDAAASTAPSAASVTFSGANAQSIAFDFGLASGDDGLLTQYATESSVQGIDPDGNGSGSLTGFDVGQDGTITGVYSNGESRTLGQVAVATFRGEEFLARAGHNLFQATRESGDAALGAAGSGGRAVAHGYALETSNVDLEKQFVKLIQSQKGYQASARIVSTADDMLKELMQTV